MLRIIALCLFVGTFRNLVDITFVGAMGPPGGGRNPITPRFSRHFNYISFTELEDSSKFRIFSTIVASWLGSFPNANTLASAGSFHVYIYVAEVFQEKSLQSGVR